MDEIQKLKKQELVLLRKEIRRRECLPHIYGQKFYSWQRRIFESRNPMTLFTAANQVGKSSILIRVHNHWATEKSLWPTLWRNRPIQFWYLYPDYGTATREFETKWVPEFMPRDEMEKDAAYGWKAHYEKGYIKYIRWNSGLITFFMAYAQQTKSMQASSVHAMFGDEEIEAHHVPELQFRLIANDGYLFCGFTATLGQELWRCAMEETGQYEAFPDAFKQQISLYDCQRFEDGSPSHWTKEKINRAIAACGGNENEIQRRIYGKFVKPEGKRYPNFSRKYHVRKPDSPLPPKEWLIYSAADLGSGVGFGTGFQKNSGGHPAAITFIAVSPDFKQGRVFKHWNGKGHLTSADDVFKRWMQMRGHLRCVSQSYDFSGKDFGIIAQRAGEGFQRANKDRKTGDDTMNSLFNNNMLIIDDTEECYPLIRELENLRIDENKTSSQDDSADSTRYTVTLIPWDWAFLNPELNLPPGCELPDDEQTQRRKAASSHHEEELDATASYETEISFWNDVAEL